MAISWLTVLQAVPWSDVIRNAPKVAEGAGKLWDAVGRKVSTKPAATSSAGSTASSPLDTRLATLEATVADLHAQMLASSQLIKDLAEQNTQLIRRAEINRVRTLWLAAVTAALALALIGVWVNWPTAPT
ncbi:hypothetical protein EIP75_17950 [Aquabacterium soli]|uniref:Uncharacterized protein n=1 Tax=Aquabacterium soli TaxID=2493092 RepID=A0A3R8YLA9_9BURK|nr:hypothetical protein [Aquabacterium soli]RRS03023.1 hypothetical protein EIP75_17950 [Aquabacterium soli]